MRTALRPAVSEITADTWDAMLGVLPPMAWRNDGLGESFKLSEYLSMRLTRAATPKQLDPLYAELEEVPALAK